MEESACSRLDTLAPSQNSIDTVHVEPSECDTEETLSYRLQKYSINTVYHSDTEQGGQRPIMARMNDLLLDTINQFTSRENSNDHTQECAYSESLQALTRHLSRVQRGLQTNALLTNVLADYCNVTKTYVESMESLIKRINVSFESESTGGVTSVACLKSYIIKMVQGQRDFMDAVLNECTISEDLNHRLDSIKEEYEELKKEFVDAEEKRSICIGHVENMYLEAKTALEMCIEASYQNPGLRSRLNEGLITVLLKFLQTKEQYDINTNKALDVNGTSKVHLEKCKLLDLKIDEFDRFRLQEIKDCLSKFTIYETAKLRNLEYDLNAMVTSLDEVDVAHISYLEKQDSNDTIVFNSTSSITPVAASINVPRIFTRYAAARISLPPPKIAVVKKVANRLERYVKWAWDPAANPKDVKLIKEFNGEMQSSLVRQIFCDLLLGKAKQGACAENMQCLERLAGLLRIVLSHAELQKDYWTGYSVLKLSTSVNAPVKGKPPIYLQTLMYSHGFWSSISFWRECLAIVIGRDLHAIFESKSKHSYNTSADSSGPITVPLTSDATSFYSWMLAFGIDKGQSQKLIVKTCQGFGLPPHYWQVLVPCGTLN